MAVQPTWNVVIQTNLPTKVATDVTAGQLSKFVAGEQTQSAICGAGETPNGCFTKDVVIADEAEGGFADTQVARSPSIVVCVAAAAITSLDVLVKAAAAGAVTPVTADLDVVAGRPLTTQATVGGLVAIDTTLMGSIYGATP